MEDMDEVLRGLWKVQAKQLGGKDGEGEGEGEGEGVQNTRMQRSLLSIRYAKLGIGRLAEECFGKRGEEGRHVKAESGRAREDAVKRERTGLKQRTKMDSSDAHDKPMIKANDNNLQPGLDPSTSTPLNVSSPTRRRSKWRLPSLVTALLSILVVWCAAETTTCSIYCRPHSCGPATPRCEYTPASPLYFGTALPIKLDEWLLSGRARPVLTASLEAAADWLADTEDLLRGRDIRTVSMDGLSTMQRRRLRRRLRAKGLGWGAVREEDAEPGERQKWEAWRELRLARERVREAREAGYLVDDVILGQDTRVW